MGGKITENLGFKFQHVFVFSHFWIPIPHAIWIFMEGEGDEIKSRQGSWNFLTLRIKMSQLIYQNRITSVLHGFCGFKVLGSFHWIDWWPKTIYVLTKHQMSAEFFANVSIWNEEKGQWTCPPLSSNWNNNKNFGWR